MEQVLVRLRETRGFLTLGASIFDLNILIIGLLFVLILGTFLGGLVI